MTNPALPSLAEPDNDPHLWLEEIDGEAAVAWVDAQSAATMARFAGPGFERDRADLLAIMDSTEKVPWIARRGDWLYNFWTDAANPRGLWRRTTMDSYRSAQPDWEILLDLDALAASEEADWIWGGSVSLPGSHDRAMLRLSVGGGDAVVLREFDVAARSFVEDGFHLPEAKGGVEWVDRDRLLVISALGEGMTTESGYGRTVRLWTRGTQLEDAQVIFEIPREHVLCNVEIARAHGAPVVFFDDYRDFFDVTLWVGDLTGAKRKVEMEVEAEKSSDGRSLAIKPRHELSAGDKTYPADTLLVIDLEAYLEGYRDFTVLFEPEQTHAVARFLWVRADTLLVSTLDRLQPRHTLWHRAADGWRSEPLGPFPEVGVSYVWQIDSDIAESDGTLIANVQDPLTAPSLMRLEAGSAPELLKAGPRSFDPSGMVVTRHEATSEDGTRIPYVQVGPEDAPADVPVHLEAYGGFGVPVLPHYVGGLGKVWLEQGGVHVSASIRGGGEFGTAWHNAGRKEGKRKSHDDFAAVAADLVARGVTVPGRIAAEGGSNGGLLIANMLTRYPERFGALFCTIPLIDMRRYTKLLAGASWVAEYGDPEVAEDWEYLGPISAYQVAEAGRDYPPILLATARKDDRVHPGHARKMAAKLQAMGYEAHLYEPPAGGHGYGKDNAERAAFMALGYAFMKDRIGWNALI